ncbi:MAG: hypothetical protein AAGB51_12200 [Planctomycetota bacterium]
MPVTADTLAPELARLAEAANAAGVFASAEVKDGRLECAADGSAEPAFYRVEADGGKVYVSLVMEDRWQSESIEAELVHTGDKLDELIEEEMAELGYTGEPLPFEHYRSSDMLFTFRTAIPAEPGDASFHELARQTLLGYEACFRQLGDMDESAGDD